MRLLVLGLLLLAACAPDPAPPAAEVRDADAGSAFALSTDSLVIVQGPILFTVAIGYPQVRGAAGEPLPAAVRAVNQAIRDSVRSLADLLRPEPPPPGVDSVPTEVDLRGGPARSFVADDVLSVLVSIDTYTGGSIPNTFFLPLTFDLGTGRALAPADLFRPGTPWADTVAAWTERGTLARLAAERRMSPAQARASFYAPALNRLRAGDVTVTLGRDSLRVHVPPYQLSSLAERSLDLGVPYAAVAPMARPGGVLARRVGR